jgi:hypothetical protein
VEKHKKLASAFPFLNVRAHRDGALRDDDDDDDDDDEDDDDDDNDEARAERGIILADRLSSAGSASFRPSFSARSARSRERERAKSLVCEGRVDIEGWQGGR